MNSHLNGYYTKTCKLNFSLTVLCKIQWIEIDKCRLTVSANTRVEFHFSDVMINVAVSQITGNSTVYSALFKLIARKIIKSRVTGALWGESTGFRWCPSQRTSYTEIFSIVGVIMSRRICTLYPKTYTHGSRFVVACCGLVPFHFTLPSSCTTTYFTGIVAIIWNPECQQSQYG